MGPKKVFVYAELQRSIPFGELDWRASNAMLKEVPGLVSKTWLSGIGTHTVGGFYEFDSVENARAFAVGHYIEVARRLEASPTVKLFDGDITEAASRDMKSPHYA